MSRIELAAALAILFGGCVGLALKKVPEPKTVYSQATEQATVIIEFEAEDYEEPWEAHERIFEEIIDLTKKKAVMHSRITLENDMIVSARITVKK